MPRVKTTIPDPSRNKGERNLDLPLWLPRSILPFSQPEWWNADVWRRIVAGQPFATTCRDTLIATVLSLDWKVEPRDSTQRDELKSEIKYYTEFIENTGDYDYSEQIEWLCKDALDTPFGAGAEIGREDDAEDGRVLWIELLDGATLYPTNNRDWPVFQYLCEAPTNIVVFPKHAINRMYYAPRTEFKYKGWGMPPPEKTYLALEMLIRGDKYYASLLLDTPQVGILDLIDMEQSAAEEWVKSWRDMLTGIDPFKIPVLYEHEKAAQFIPFTRNPAELMFDKAIMKYAALVAAGYNMSLSDIGISPVSSGGETLAGSIRQERKTRKTGLAVLKRKLKSFYDRILPETLEMNFVDLDDELSVAVGRARLASATAIDLLVQRRILTPNEGRLQLIADGLISVTIPEKVEGGDELAPEPLSNANTNKRGGDMGKPIAPSQGGYGESKSLTEELLNVDET